MKGTLYVTGILLALAIGIVVGANISKPATTPGRNANTTTASVSVSPASRPEWETPDDPIYDFASAVSPDAKMYVVAGTETWRFVHRDGKKPDRIAGTPKAYLCLAGQAKAKELEIPKISGTNQFARNLTSPVFSRDGKNIVATLHYQNGSVAKLFIISWNVKTGAPSVIHKMPADLCCMWEEENMPEEGSLAEWYTQVSINPGPEPKAVPHTIWIGKQSWDY